MIKSKKSARAKARRLESAVIAAALDLAETLFNSYDDSHAIMLAQGNLLDATERLRLYVAG